MIDVEERTEQKTEPPKRWLNWWRAKVAGVTSCAACNASFVVLRGEVFAGDYCDHVIWHDSKFMAELAALECDCPEWLEYVGAFPEGERP